MQDAGARQVSNAEGMPRMVRKNDCALPAQYTKHSNARGHSLSFGFRFGFGVYCLGLQAGVAIRLSLRVGNRVRARVEVSLRVVFGVRVTLELGI